MFSSSKQQLYQTKRITNNGLDNKSKFSGRIPLVCISFATVSTVLYAIFYYVTVISQDTLSKEFVSVLHATNTLVEGNDEEIDPSKIIIVDATTTTFLENMKNNKDGGIDHRVAGLNCNSYGGPYTKEATERMIYWYDIPNDNNFHSTLKHPTEEQFLTLEPDEGGWNNIRMNMETAIGIAIMTGRTLVLPPKNEIYLLHHGESKEKQYTFNDFFHFDSVFAEHYTNNENNPTFKVITFNEFLEQIAMKDKFLSRKTSLPTYPPDNRTNWDGADYQKLKTVWEWMRESALPLEWNNDKCVGAFPSKRGNTSHVTIEKYLQEIINPNNVSDPPSRAVWQDIGSYKNNPTPVDDIPINRLREILGVRNNVCMYDELFQNAKVAHTLGSSKYRLLVHFYAFLFFENYHYDLWYKRFVRDHFRYVDEVQCASARIVDKLKQIAKQHSADGIDDTFDTMHVRRGDLQYQEVRDLTAEDIYTITVSKYIKPNRTLFIATDERDLSFFKVFKEHYNVYFLNDFHNDLGESVSKNYYGMIDQLVASQGVVFVGCYFSTFTGYINRIRGYHHQKQKLKGYELGHINSYYYIPNELIEFQTVMTKYRSVQPTLWSQEYAVCWRDINHDVTEYL